MGKFFLVFALSWLITEIGTLYFETLFWLIMQNKRKNILDAAKPVIWILRLKVYFAYFPLWILRQTVLCYLLINFKRGRFKEGRVASTYLIVQQHVWATSATCTTTTSHTNSFDLKDFYRAKRGLLVNFKTISWWYFDLGSGSMKLDAVFRKRLSVKSCLIKIF